jgi:hypothetical protein
MIQKHFYRAFTLVTLAGYVWIGGNLIWGDDGRSGMTLCLFKRLTGVACPSCGATRSMLALLHGDAGYAFHINPLGFVLLPMLIILPWWLCTDFVLLDNSLYRTSGKLRQTFIKYRWTATTGAILLIANWGWNIFKTL